jgi:beta-mannan synthase
MIQVCDDSTKESIRKKVNKFVAEKRLEGHPVTIVRRPDRIGYKAGAMVAGMNAIKGQPWKYVAIFDADFHPPRNFLKRTIPKMEKDEGLAFVQSRWVFTNVNSLITWFQFVNLRYHFRVEQTARSYSGSFFGFNGTGGVWRIAAVDNAGGWRSDTVVEDMDLSLRAYLKGWRFTYIHDIKCPNELPATHNAYRVQQFRWIAGPMQILRASLFKIYQAKNISWLRRLSCYVFFLRYIHNSILTIFSLWCAPVIMFLEPFNFDASNWFFIISMNASVLLYMYIDKLAFFYLIFSIALGCYKTAAMISGALNLKSSQVWIVTPKSNGKEAGFNCVCPYGLESFIALYYIALALYSINEYKYYNVWMCLTSALVYIYAALGDIDPCNVIYQLMYANKSVPKEDGIQEEEDDQTVSLLAPAFTSSKDK